MTEVSWGPAVVQVLIAQRPPMLWLDRITAVSLDPPRLRGARYLSANEAVLSGHFPQLGLMPGVLALEGAAQAAEALASILALSQTGDAFAELGNVELGATFDPRYDSDRATRLRVERPPSVAGSARAKFLRPIFPGCRVDFEVAMTRRLDHTAHFEVEASVDGQLAVRGSFTTARLDRAW